MANLPLFYLCFIRIFLNYFGSKALQSILFQPILSTLPFLRSNLAVLFGTLRINLYFLVNQL